ncbi:hypothetical protein BH10PSE2_BH10PSE2_16760 [soil metagenome]
MKRGFSIGEALGAPFALLRRRPISVFVWGAVTVALSGLAWALILPSLSTLSPEMMRPGGQMDAASLAALNRMSAGLNGLNLLNFLVGLIVFTAILRATSRPARGDAFAFLRLGMGEVRVAVGIIAIAIGSWLVAVVLTLLGIALWFGVASLGQPASVAIVVVYGIVATLAWLWLLGRIILIVPLSLIQNTFAFDEGWALGKGQSGKLILTAILSWIILLLVEVIGVLLIGAAGMGIAVAMGFVMPDMNSLSTLQEGIEAFRPLAVPAMILAIPACLLFGLLQAIWAAPLASAAMQLLGSSGVDGDPIAPGARPSKPTKRGGGERRVREPFPDLAMPVAAAATGAVVAHEADTQELVVQDPVVSDPAVHDTPVHAGHPVAPVDVAEHAEAVPAAQDHGTHEPGTHEPGTHEPGTHDPGTHDPGTHDPGTHDPGIGSHEADDSHVHGDPQSPKGDGGH